ncbi:carbonic anhydrase 1-like [Anopheles stephensi]|uniref:carbonic anhydrase 1-like n=1 Tax=Anopheles stephensi TaxID=30069 RepID=UPI0016589D40|nr:carbonic anhydrase 1-like [Anopheles stephensi]
MKTLSSVCYLVCFLVIQTTSDEWNYPTPGSNGVMSEPEKWGGQCDNGRRQSPIDLTQAAAVRGEFTPFFFNNYKLPIKQALLANTGHSVQISNRDPAVTIQGGGLDGRFALDQMHFHWGSEHTIDKTRFGLELHLVHHDSRYSSLEAAAATRNGVAVIGVLFHVSDQPNMHIDVILDAIADIRNEAGKETLLKGKLSPHYLLPVNRTTFYRYEGSLTTPACAESVIWTVFANSVGVSLEQIEQFKAIHDQNGRELVNNFRSIQPLNARALVYVNVWDGQGNSLATALRLDTLLLGLVGTLMILNLRTN